MARKILLVLVVFLAACSAGAEQLSNELEGTVINEPGPISDVFPTQTSIPKVKEVITPTPGLPNQGPAPELTNDVWLNTDHPLRLEDLRGEVVLLEMWTFG